MDDAFWEDASPDNGLLGRLVGSANVKDPKVDAVFEGGGVKAIAQVGAVRAAEKIGLRWNRLAGTSGGAIVASLLAAELPAKRIWEILTQTDLSRLMDVFYLPNVSLLRRFKYFLLPLLPNLVFFKGALEGKEFEKLMRQHLRKQEADGSERDLTFGDLKVPNKTEWWESQYRLKIVATDIVCRQPVVFPDDAELYEEYKNKDDMPVYEAVRMSGSLPAIFKPVTLHRRGTRKKCVIVDGGVSSNFPIWLFDRPSSAGKPHRPTFGFLIDEGIKIHRICSVVGLLWNTFHTAMGAMDRRLSPWDEDRTIRIPSGGVSTWDFNLSPEKQRRLRDWGYGEALAFFRQFDWEKHISKFRSGPPTSG